MNTTSTTTVHTRVSLSGPPTTTQASSHPAARYGERDSSAASSTSTDEPPDPISKAAGHTPRTEDWHGTRGGDHRRDHHPTPAPRPGGAGQGHLPHRVTNHRPADAHPAGPPRHQA